MSNGTDPETPINPDPQPPDGILPPVDVPKFDASINELFITGSKRLAKYLEKHTKGSHYPGVRSPDEEPWTVEDVLVKPNIPGTPESIDSTMVTLHLNQVEQAQPKI
jgi:hypothetical protein